SRGLVADRLIPSLWYTTIRCMFHSCSWSRVTKGGVQHLIRCQALHPILTVCGRRFSAMEVECSQR
ncbi:hypothetical protein NDU88_004584, partial [Pleurodeles waltl]